MRKLDFLIAGKISERSRFVNKEIYIKNKKFDDVLKLFNDFDSMLLSRLRFLHLQFLMFLSPINLLDSKTMQVNIKFKRYQSGEE